MVSLLRRTPFRSVFNSVDVKSCPYRENLLTSKCLCKHQPAVVHFHLSNVNKTFWERDKKSGYGGEVEQVSKKKLILDGLKELRQEIALWKDEVKERLESDPVLVFRPGEVDVAFEFKDKKDLNKWVVTTDSDHNEGRSKAAFEISSSGCGIFHGYVDSQVPKDGKIKRSGYANIKTLRARKSFKRETTYDWRQYNTLVLKVRGDGRSYLLNLHTEGYFDIMWNDIYHYVLYTRGGPHWQYTKIPFSKFFLSSKGRVQDRQGPIPLDRVTNIGFSVGARGGHEGNFSLEIDYIGLEFDPSHREEFAYEMYKQQKYIVATYIIDISIHLKVTEIHEKPPKKNRIIKFSRLKFN